ncbi:MAG: hypothetical protein KDB21_11380 [Acidimicrobiales bacterium]|nr:hypothetical protein [Acidimicrobiales bacterium]
MARTTAMAAYGVSIDLPSGWDGEIFLREVDDGPIHREQTASMVLHAANFALPPDRGDFGSGAVNTMGSGGVVVCLVEYDPEAVGTALFDKPLPRSVIGDDFNPDGLQKPIPGQAGAQAFGSENGRAFCLYAVIGSWLRRNALAPIINQALATLDIGPRTY